jgi:hypothetical protein
VYYSKIGVTALYLKVTQSITSLLPIARLGIARIQSGYDLTHFNVTDTQQILLGVVAPQGVKEEPEKGLSNLIKSILTGKVKLPYTPISAQHLRHITVRELTTIMSKIDRAMIKRLSVLNNLVDGSFNKDLHEAAFVGIALWLITLDEKMFQLFRYSDIFNKIATLAEWQKAAKALSLKFKSLQNIVGWNLTSCFEMDVLVNRGVGAVDWNQEKLNRTTGINTTDHSYGEIIHEAIKLFKDAKRTSNIPIKLEWSEFWSRRWEWAPTGSFHSQYEEDMVDKPKERELRTKLYMATRQPDYQIEHFLSRKRQMRAWPSTKYEWGKQRAIYGVDYTNFVLSGFAFAGAEACVPNYCPIGDRAKEELVHAAVTETLKGQVPYCLDYDDFNSQHSLTSMEAVLDAYLAVFNNDLSPEQQCAVVWVRDALRDSEVVDTVTTGGYKSMGTLWSGWRLTTFMNTVLNCIYTSMAKGSRKLASLHAGDDVLLGISTLREVFDINDALLNRNARIQDSKCFVSGIAEFLRVDHKQRTSSQYLARGISTLVHGPVESVIPNDLGAVVEAINTRVEEFRSRSLNDSLSDVIKKVLLARSCEIWHIDTELIDDYITTHRACGGIGDDEMGGVDHLFRIVDENEDKYNSKQDRATEVFPGAVAYAKYITKTLFDDTLFKPVYKRVRDSILSPLASSRWTIERDTRNHPVTWWFLVKQRYKALATAPGYGKAKLAKMFGIPIVGLRYSATDVYKELMQYDDRLFWASKLL